MANDRDGGHAPYGYERTDTVKIGALKEIFDGEARVAMTPDSALQLQKLGYTCLIEKGAGEAAGFSDAAYENAGVEIMATPAALAKAANVLVKVRPPEEAEIKRFRKNQTVISFFYPAANEDLMEQAAKKKANVIAMDMVAAHIAGAEDGRAVFHGQYRRLPRGD